MFHHRDEQIEPKRRTSSRHLRLHSATPLESGAASDDERQVVRAQAGVVRRRVQVRISGRRQDGARLHAGVKALFLEGNALQVREGEAVGGTLCGVVS